MSMRAYAVISPTFWIGETGREIRALGRDAMLVALYLVTGPLSTMTGLYYLPLTTLCHETGVEPEVARTVLDALGRIGFAYYDDTTEHVWVPNMARFQVGAGLKVKDRRVEGIVNQLRPLRNSPFLPAFIERYAKPFNLVRAKGWRELTQALRRPSDAPSKELQGAIEGPSKDYRRGSSQDQEQKQKQEQDKKQGKEGGDDPAPPAAAPPSPSGRNENPGSRNREPEALAAPVATPQQLVDAWNTCAPKLLPARELSPSRLRVIQQRLRERADLTFWESLFKRMNASAFCRGQNKQDWTADLDFALRPDKIASVLEGRYDDGPAVAAQAAALARADAILAEAKRRLAAGEPPE